MDGSTTIKPAYGQPALIGGLVMGVLSALPLVNAGNLCCCAWVIGGGLVAAYLLQQNHPTPITPGDGALVGLLAGLIGAVVWVAVSIPLDILLSPFERALTQRILDMSGNIPENMRDVLETYSRGGPQPIGFMIIGRIVSVVFGLVIGAIFSTLGGLLGAAIFRKPDAPPGVIDVPPPA